MGDLDVDFEKLLHEDDKFMEFSKTVVLDAFSSFNAGLIPMIWSLYQADMSTEQAAYTLKFMIKYGGPPNGQQPPRGNSQI